MTDKQRIQQLRIIIDKLLSYIDLSKETEMDFRQQLYYTSLERHREKTENKPNNDRDVLVYFYGGGVTTAYYDSKANKWFDYTGDELIPTVKKWKEIPYDEHY